MTASVYFNIFRAHFHQTHHKTQHFHQAFSFFILHKVFNNGASKICGRQPLKNLKGYGLLKQTIPLQIF